MYLVYFGEISVHRFQHKVVNHIYMYIYNYIYVFARLPLLFGTFTSPYLFGKRSRLPFFLSFPAHLRPFSRSLLRKSMMIWMCSLLSAQVNMLKHELLQPIFFLWTIVHVSLSLSFGKMTLVPFHVAGRLNPARSEACI